MDSVGDIVTGQAEEGTVRAFGYVPVKVPINSTVESQLLLGHGLLCRRHVKWETLVKRWC